MPLILPASFRKTPSPHPNDLPKALLIRHFLSASGRQQNNGMTRMRRRKRMHKFRGYLLRQYHLRGTDGNSCHQDPLDRLIPSAPSLALPSGEPPSPPLVKSLFASGFSQSWFLWPAASLMAMPLVFSRADPSSTRPATTLPAPSGEMLNPWS